MANEHYGRFIEDAFVKPIRSVLIVDDDYPTFDEMLDLEIAHTGEGRPDRTPKKWYDNPDRIKAVIDSFRRPERPMLVDIHDGTNVDARGDAKVAAHLHQSDLLVLDYELDKTRPGDGQRAIDILRSLMANDHFNLVVVHTSENLETVYREIIVGLLPPSIDQLSEEEAVSVQGLIGDQEDADEEFDAKIRAALARDQYLHSRLFPDAYTRVMAKGHQPYTQYFEIAQAAGWDSDQRKLVLRHFLLAEEARFRGRMHPQAPAGMKWSMSGTKWVRTDSIFIAFSEKADKDDLLGDLQKALEAWNPEPSRLFLAKLRAEMDEYGVVAQSAALERRHALAHWYARLLRATGAERRWLIAESVGRHSDQLLHQISGRVERFAMDLIEAEATVCNPDERCHEHFDIDLTKDENKKRAVREHNAFVCSKPPRGWHLTTGHVLRIDEDYWVCLTPACDLVPSQSGERAATFGSRLPFMAVKLHPVRNGKAPDMNSNLFIFLNIGEEIKGFGFNVSGKEGSAPQWRTLYAENRGIFADDLTLKIAVMQPGRRRLISVVKSATIVSQLRYEYALNLLQKFGASMTRIGLDFAN